MRNLFAIAKREIGSYLVSPIAYLVTAAFLFLVGLHFWITLAIMVEYRELPTVRHTIEFAVIIFVFAAPLLTMRLLAQERRMGTLELVLTSPVREWELVMGKFCAGLVFYLMMVLPTLLYPLTLEVFGNPDWGPIWSGYLGLILFGAVLLSVGVLTSALTQSQIIAAVLGIAGDFTLYFFIGWFAYIPGASPRVANILHILNLQEHLQTFLSGAPYIHDIIYCLSMTAFFLFITTRVLEARRWRA